MEGRSIPIARRVILYQYFDQVFSQLKGKNNFTKEELNQAFETALKNYSKDSAMKIYHNPIEQLEAAEQELAKLKKIQADFELKSKRYSSRMLYLAFSNCAIQLGGMYYLIFGLYSWEVMESITYMVCKYKNK